MHDRQRPKPLGGQRVQAMVPQSQLSIASYCSYKCSRVAPASWCVLS